MPEYYCPKSSIRAYEVVLDSDLLRKLTAARQELRNYLRGIAEAVQSLTGDNVTKITGASGLRRQVQRIREVPFLGTWN